MDRDLFLALLSLDAYNRGYGQNVLLNLGDSTTGQGESGRTLGDAIILNVDSPEGSQAAGFYAIAYQLGDEKIISYRGTDGSSDFFAFGIGAGQPFALTGGLTAQARLTIEFYRAVAGADADPFAANDNQAAWRQPTQRRTA